MTVFLPAMSKRDLDKFEVVRRFIRHEITRAHAAGLLRLTERQVTRLTAKVAAGGASALIHASRGRPSPNRIPEKERGKMVTLLKSKYPDFSPTFAAEKLAEVHGIVRDPKTVRTVQIAEGLWKPRRGKTKTEHREWRQRRSAYGEMLQFDGSYHDWLEGRGGHGTICLLAAIDDATGRVVMARFAEHEGVFPVLRFWREFVETHGKPRSIYLDKFSTYKMNAPLAKENPDVKTQFGRAMADLGVEPIFANSPQAKGRVERLFETLQNRLVKELRLAGISSPEEANRFLGKYLPKFNAKFSVEPASPADLHRMLTAKESASLPAVMSRHEERTVLNDFTFSFGNVWRQVTEEQPVTVQKKDVVTVEEWLDGTLHVRLRGKELNVRILPERPKKKKQPWAIAQGQKVPTKPSSDHPWRKRFLTDAKIHAKSG